MGAKPHYGGHHSEGLYALQEKFSATATVRHVLYNIMIFMFIIQSTVADASYQ
jgi:hypothetical protein